MSVLQRIRKSIRNVPDLLDIGIVTWNVGNEQPFVEKTVKDSLTDLIPRAYDVFAIGVQECTYSTNKDDAAARDDDEDDRPEPKAEEPPQPSSGRKGKPAGDLTTHAFEKIIIDHAEALGMVKVESATLLQMRLIVFVRKTIKYMVGEVKVAREATGLLSLIGNKGGIACSIKVLGTRIAFVSCHLAAHLHQIHARNNDVIEILKGIHMFDKRLDLTAQCDHLFWFGDMNYRIDLDYQAGVKPIKFKTDSEEHISNFLKVTTLITEKKFDALMEKDQLRLEMKRGAIFSNFSEGPMRFAPTFKVRRERQLTADQETLRDAGQLTFYTTQRIPSYCDRVIWKSMPGAKDRVLFKSVESVESLFTSDHKPVRAEFSFIPEQYVGKHSSQANNSQLIVADLRAIGGNMDEREGVYLQFASYPKGLLTSYMTGARPKPDWADCVFNFRLKTIPSSYHRVHLIVSVLDDKIGVDETVGDVIIPMDERVEKDWVQFDHPLVLNGVASGARLVGKARVVTPHSEGWVEWKKRVKYSSRSIRQMI